MSRQTDEGGVDLSSQQDVGFSMDGARWYRTPLTDTEKEEAGVVSGEIVELASTDGPTRTRYGASPDGHLTTYAMDESEKYDPTRRTRVKELVIAISDTREHRTQWGPGTVAVELRINPFNTPSLHFEEHDREGGGAYYSHEASSGELRAILGVLRDGPESDPRAPTWRKPAPQK